MRTQALTDAVAVKIALDIVAKLRRKGSRAPGRLFIRHSSSIIVCETASESAKTKASFPAIASRLVC